MIYNWGVSYSKWLSQEINILSSCWKPVWLCFCRTVIFSGRLFLKMASLCQFRIFFDLATFCKKPDNSFIRVCLVVTVASYSKVLLSVPGLEYTGWALLWFTSFPQCNLCFFFYDHLTLHASQLTFHTLTLVNLFSWEALLKKLWNKQAFNKEGRVLHHSFPFRTRTVVIVNWKNYLSVKYFLSYEGYENFIVVCI